MKKIKLAVSTDMEGINVQVEGKQNHSVRNVRVDYEKLTPLAKYIADKIKPVIHEGDTVNSFILEPSSSEISANIIREMLGIPAMTLYTFTFYNKHLQPSETVEEYFERAAQRLCETAQNENDPNSQVMANRIEEIIAEPLFPCEKDTDGKIELIRVPINRIFQE